MILDLAPSRRGAIATAIQAALDSGAKLNMTELAIAVIEWRSQETHETVQGQLDRILERCKEPRKRPAIGEIEAEILGRKLPAGYTLEEDAKVQRFNAGLEEAALAVRVVLAA